MEEKEIVAKVKNCKTVEELKAVGIEIGYNLTDEEAKIFLEQVSKSGELPDDELSNVTGGCTWWRKGRAYSGNPPHYLITTAFNTCPSFSADYKHHSADDRRTFLGKCRVCCHTPWDKTVPMYCHERTYDNDPYNPKK